MAKKPNRYNHRKIPYIEKKKGLKKENRKTNVPIKKNDSRKVKK